MNKTSLLVILFASFLIPGSAQDGAPPLPSGLGAGSQAASQPALPAGLGGGNTLSGDGPALPSGLNASDSSGPVLPAGLSESSTSESTQDGAPSLDSFKPFGFSVHGFIEARGGMRTQNDPYISKDASILEPRLQLETERTFSGFAFDTAADFYYDGVLDDALIDLRRASVSYSPFDFMDIRMGRQILTWGTGDMIFINDLFPKDWQAFFIGRDVEYLKAPSDALKTSFFTDWFNVDVVYTPQFDNDRYIRGERLSYWSDALGRRAGESDPVIVNKPDDWFQNDEAALRIYRTIASYEVALYGYRGYWKSMAGQDPLSGAALFPPLSAYGASVRGSVGPGIGNLELGYYDSEDDSHGDNPFIRNSEFRFLAGYEQELAKNLTGAVQYYLEAMMDYGAYRNTLPAGIRPHDENRYVLTFRLTRLLFDQDLTLSYFTYYSPSDQDAYMRFNAHYKVTDALAVEAGANWFLGREENTFFGQFEKNTNVYAAVRYSF